MHTNSRIVGSLLAVILITPIAHAQVVEEVLFDFAKEGALKHWSNLELPKAKEPAVKMETDNGRLKLTFVAGNWPTVTTTKVTENWMPFHTFKATVTVSRTVGSASRFAVTLPTAVVAFTAQQCGQNITDPAFSLRRVRKASRPLCALL